MKNRWKWFRRSIAVSFTHLAVVTLASLPTLAIGNSVGVVWRAITPVSEVNSTASVQSDTFELNRDALEQMLAPLASAARGASIDEGESSVFVPLPNADGQLIDFEVRAERAMSLALAARYSSIQAFSAHALYDGLMIDVRMVLTPSSLSVHAESGSTRWTLRQSELNSDLYSVSRSVQSGTLQCGFDAGRAGDSGNDIGAPVSEMRSPLLDYRGDTDGVSTYRLAIATTGEFGAVFGDTTSTLAALVLTVNRLNAITERELGYRFELIDETDAVIFLDPATDPFDGNDDKFLLVTESQNVFDSRIGDANYDIGHVISYDDSGGIAYFGICQSDYKGTAVTGLRSSADYALAIGHLEDHDLATLAHEIGHQLGASHSFNGIEGDCLANYSGVASFEPGSGSTLMSYAGVCESDNIANSLDHYFHSGSRAEIERYRIQNGLQSCAAAPGNGGTTELSASAGSDFTIPVDTAFLLAGSSTDTGSAYPPLHTWEALDAGGQASLTAPDDGSIPLFRSYLPTISRTRILPELTTLASGNDDLAERLPQVAREMNWRFTARDQDGGIRSDDLTITVDPSVGPFRVTAPAAGVVVDGSVEVTWDVAGTDGSPVNSPEVDIYLSTFNGLRFEYGSPLARNTPNDGVELVQLPDLDTSLARVMVRGTGSGFLAINPGPFTIQGSESGACPAAEQQTTYLADWESGSLGDWFETVISGPSVWQASGVRPDEGTFHARGANADQDLVESLLTLDQTLFAEGGVLELRHLPDFSNSAYGAGIIEISVDDGGSWTNISDVVSFLANGYTGVVYTHSYSSGTRGFDQRGTSPGYRTSLIDLAPLEGIGFRIRLRKVAGYSGTGNAPWDIDRIRVYNCSQPGPPAAATLISPSESAELQAVYEWQPVSDASWYQIWVSNEASPESGSNGYVYRRWVTAANAGCDGAASMCSHEALKSIGGRQVSWWIQTWNTEGYGPWSAPLGYDTGYGPNPPATQMLAPAGPGVGALPVYRWESRNSASWYWLWVEETGAATQPTIARWITAADAGCAGGGECSVSSSVSVANGGTAWVLTYGEDQGVALYGDWSPALSFQP